MAARPTEGEHNAATEAIVAELQRAGASGAVVADQGNLDELVANMVNEGYTLGETVYVGGKRIRYLTLPSVVDAEEASPQPEEPV